MQTELQLREAKATLSAVIDQAIGGHPTIITRHGHREAVVIGYAEWQRLTTVPSFGELLALSPLTDDDLPDRAVVGPAREVDL